MIRLENMLPKAFLLGIVEVVNEVGPEKAHDWLVKIAQKIGESEGGGIEGAREGDLHYLPTSPCITDIREFIEIFGHPDEFDQIVEHSNNLKDNSTEGWKYPALTDILGILHHWYNYKRAEMMGIRLLNVGTRCPLNEKYVYNEKAMQRANMTKEDVDKVLEKGYYVYKMEKIKQE
ncbi:hypothetical protein D5R95_00335 [Methanosalsum natronophilum]|uniref:Uncharacterized protein n=1 Tax=Methanosalsum natronophilum TaxID=768733 RepID=A0A424Z4I8_9EURY|nr:MAG: hypothetical protein D5R95_00335 [Methanosalsum natronophilum]